MSSTNSNAVSSQRLKEAGDKIRYYSENLGEILKRIQSEVDSLYNRFGVGENPTQEQIYRELKIMTESNNHVEQYSQYLEDVAEQYMQYLEDKKKIMDIISNKSDTQETR